MIGFHVAQIDHVEFFVPDRFTAAAWYARTLGLQVVPGYESWAADPQGPLMIATPEAGTKLALFTGEPQGVRSTAGFYRVAFRVSRQAFEAFLVHVRENPVCGEEGEEVRELAVRDHGAALSVYFRDPYGHRLEVTTYDVAPPAAPGEEVGRGAEAEPVVRRPGRFSGRVALVTGAASGIGRETARQLGAEGAAVCCADLNESRVKETVGLMAQVGLSASAHRLDVGVEAEWEAVVQQILSAHGRLDVLVNCAGVSAAALLTEMSYTDWRRVLAVNLDGAFLGTKYGIRAMRTVGGSIVHVSSASGVKASAGACAYSTSKAGLCMLSRAAAKECRDQGIPVRVNTVCPGGVKTPMWTTMPFFRELVEKAGSEEAAFESMSGGVPGGRFSEPADIAQAILFLASDESRFVTGIDLLVDGGYVL